ncbi:MAG: DUF190 domain-containing protein [Acidimicrobiales bacterium]
MGDGAHGVRMQRMTVMLGSRDHAHHHSLATEVLARAKRANLAGATLLQAEEGQGRSGALHRHHLFREDMSLSLVVVDSEAKIAPFLDSIREVLGDALVIVEDVTAFRA